MFRNYAFECYCCSYKFDLTIDSELISNYKSKCPQCNSKEVFRDYFAEKIMVGSNEPRTVGALADKRSRDKGIQINGPYKSH